MPSTQVTILLADADQMRREGLSTILSREGGFRLVGSVGDGETALLEVRRQRPDLVVLDLNLPTIYGTQLVRGIRAEAPQTKIIVMAVSTDEATVKDAVRAGGDGYVLRTGPAKHLVAAIHHVLDGGRYFSPQLTGRPVDETQRADPSGEPGQSGSQRAQEADFDADDDGVDPDEGFAEKLDEVFRPLHERLTSTTDRVSSIGKGQDRRVPPRPRRRATLRDRIAQALHPDRADQDPGTARKARDTSGTKTSTQAGPAKSAPDSSTSSSSRGNTLFERLQALDASISEEPVTARRRRRTDPPPPPPAGTKLGDILDSEEDLEFSKNPGASLFGPDQDSFDAGPRRKHHRAFGSGRAKHLKVVWVVVLIFVICVIVGFVAYHVILSGVIDKLTPE